MPRCRGWRVNGENVQMTDTYYRRRPDGSANMNTMGGEFHLTPGPTNDDANVEVIKPPSPYNPNAELNALTRLTVALFGPRARSAAADDSGGEDGSPQTQ